MAELLWYDQIDRVRNAHKRHVYREKNGTLIRVCNVSDNGGISKSRSKLERVKATEIARDPNACNRCLKTEGLDKLQTKPKGADNVEYDPFGVFE